MPSLWSRRAERKCSFVISELFSCDARSCAACSASCIFCVYLSMRMVQNNQGAVVSKPPFPKAASASWLRPRKLLRTGNHCVTVLRRAGDRRSLNLSRHSAVVIRSLFGIRASSLSDCIEQEQEHEQEQDYKRNNRLRRLTQTPLQR